MEDGERKTGKRETGGKHRQEREMRKAHAPDPGRQGGEQEGVKVKTITREREACVCVQLPGSVSLSVH